MLYVNNLYKCYGDFWAVSNLNLHIPKGDLFGFVGPNGAGKTTTIRIICGLLKSTSGEVIVDGNKSIKDGRNIKKDIGYVPDFFGVYDNLKVSEYLEFFGSLYGMSYRDTRNVADGLLDLVNLRDKKDVFVDTLSRGMKQRLCVARALLHNPALLVMDEPSSGLDPGARVEMKELLMNLRSMGKTILISSHILADISEMCNSIGIMNRGNLVAAGLMSDILNIGNDTSRLIIEIKSDINAAVAVMQEQPDVKIEAVKENEIVVTGIDTDEKANMLVGQLMVRGVLVGGFHRDEHSLESIFMEITTGKAAQAGTVGQSGSAGQANPYGQQNPYGEQGQIIQPGVVNPYDQANQFGAGQFGQPNQFAQSGQFGQPNRFAQSGQFGQPNQFVQPGQFGAGQSAQPGQFNQQPDQSNQMGGYDNAGN
ncbi:MAG: ATP-binding cassette domain-containing protein [Eubacterium sp.]|nr:ATP-binding cassette domain-containing protein [Eubacterium sp.]